MQNIQPHEIFAAVSMAFLAAPDALRRTIEARAGAAFPARQISDVKDRPTYECLDAVDRALAPFFERCPHEMQELGRNQGVDIARAMSHVSDMKPFRAKIMPEYVEAEGGGLKAIPHFAPSTGEVRYGSLGQAAVSGAATLTVFSHQIRAEPVYPGQAALDARIMGKPMPEPCGVVANYRVAIYDGEVLMPPRHPSDMAALDVDEEGPMP